VRIAIAVTAVALLFVGCIFLTGCAVVPRRVPPRSVGTGGAVGEADLSFLRIGVTTKATVHERLGWADTGYVSERLFLARWVSSSLRVDTYIVGPSAAEKVTEEVWKDGNLLIEFDANGIVKSVRPFRDFDWLRQVVYVVAQEDRRSENPIRRQVTLEPDSGPETERAPRGPAVVTLEYSGLRIECFAPRPRDFFVSKDHIKRLEYGGRPGDQPSASGVPFLLKLSTDTPAGKEIRILVDIPTLVLLVQYLRDSQPASLR